MYRICSLTEDMGCVLIRSLFLVPHTDPRARWGSGHRKRRREARAGLTHAQAFCDIAHACMYARMHACMHVHIHISTAHVEGQIRYARVWKQGFYSKNIKRAHTVALALAFMRASSAAFFRASSSAFFRASSAAFFRASSSPLACTSVAAVTSQQALTRHYRHYHARTRRHRH